MLGKNWVKCTIQRGDSSRWHQWTSSMKFTNCHILATLELNFRRLPSHNQTFKYWLPPQVYISITTSEDKTEGTDLPKEEEEGWGCGALTGALSLSKKKGRHWRVKARRVQVWSMNRIRCLTCLSKIRFSWKLLSLKQQGQFMNGIVPGFIWGQPMDTMRCCQAWLKLSDNWSN